MRKHVIRFDQFLVWKFFMNKGDIKTFTREEITRGLTDYGDMTMNSISVFVRGSFVTHRDGMPPLYNYPGTGGARFVEAKSLEGFAVEALEDGSEYHCITPRDEVPTFWNRGVVHWENIHAEIPKGRYVYLADGNINIDGKKLQVGQMARVKRNVMSRIEEKSIIAFMWPNEPQV